MKIIFVFFLIMSCAVATIPLFNTVMRSVNTIWLNLRLRYVCILCIIAFSCFSDISYTRQTVAQVRCIHYLLLIRHTSTLYLNGLSPPGNSLLLRLSKCSTHRDIIQSVIDFSKICYERPWVWLFHIGTAQTIFPVLMGLN